MVGPTWERTSGHSRFGNSRGQGLAEFAFVLPILLLIMLGAIDLGRVYFGWVNLNNAARIAANYAAANPEGPFTTGSTYDVTVRRDTGGINCTSLNVPSPTFSPDTNVGSSATVTLDCDFALISQFLGPVPLSATAIFPVRGGTIVGVPGSDPGECTSPRLVVPQLVGSEVSAARAAWSAAGFTGPFYPANGQNNKVVVGQVPFNGDCRVPSTTVSVTYQ